MVTKQSILVACVAAALVFALYWCGVRGCKGCKNCKHAHMSGGSYGAYAAQPEPWSALHRRMDLVRGYKGDGYRQPSGVDTAEGLAARRRSGATVKIDSIEGFAGGREGFDTYHRAGSALNPEAMNEAERSAWTAVTEAEGAKGFNAETVHDSTGDAMQYHSTEPPIDYDAYITDLVVDPRTRENHSKWATEMLPFSGTAMTVDNLDEAMEATIDFRGLRRPQMVAQYNPLQVTERDTSTLAGNRKFTFLD